MQKTKPRNKVWERNPKFAQETRHKVLVPDEVAVENPVTKETEIHVVNTFKDEVVIDPHLRASDFSLEVQLKHAPDLLKDCGKFFTPENPEQYVDLIRNLDSRIQKQIDIETVKPEPTPEPTLEPSPKAE